MDDLIQVGEAGRILGRSINTVLIYENRGLLPKARRQLLTGNRLWRRADVEALARRLREPVAP